MAKALLIIEDDPFIRRFYDRLFREKDYETDLAGNAEEGLSKAKLGKPDLILLDIMMPNKNGLEVLKELKNHEETKNITVLMLTNINEQSTVAEATRLGASGFLVKANIEPDQLQKIVESYI